MTSMMPAGTAVTVDDASVEEMEAEIRALISEFRERNPDYAAAVSGTTAGLPDDFFATPIRSVGEARDWTRMDVVYGTPQSEYADFLVDLYDLYRTQGAWGIEALQELTGGEIEELVNDGTLPSHDAYKKFNLLAFYASLVDPQNEQWLRDQPKTTVRADERVDEVLTGVTQQMRIDAADLLAASMAEAYGTILNQDGTAGLDMNKHHDVPTPPLPPVDGVPTTDDVRSDVQAAEVALLDEAEYHLTDVQPLVQEVKLTAMNELTLILNELTSLTEVYETLETYYYSYNYYYHYERLERTWWSMLYIVDHIEQRDLVEYELFIKNTYELIDYLYEYSDSISVQGLLSGLIGLDYTKVVPPEAQEVMPGGGLVEGLNHPPDEVQVVLEYVMPFTFDIVDEISLSYIQEVVDEIVTYVRNEVHYYWEYHIRNYWYWDPLNEDNTPFANSLLNNAADYLVTVSEDLDVGKVLNVIPIRDMYMEANVNFYAPASEYPLLEKATRLTPAPVGFMPNQVTPGEATTKLADYVHMGPAPNAAKADVNAMRLADRIVGAANEVEGTTWTAYSGGVELVGETFGDPTALYGLIPEEVRVNSPDVPEVAVPEATVTVPSDVDTGVDTYQALGWEVNALPSFVPQFAFAGVHAVPTMQDGDPIVVTVNARGLGAPVTLVADLNDGLVPAAQAALAEEVGVETPALTVPDAPEATPDAVAPHVAYLQSLAAWGNDATAWFRENL